MADHTLQSTQDPQLIARLAGTSTWTVAGSPQVMTVDVDQSILDDAVVEYNSSGFTIETIRSTAKVNIDQVAERTRLRYITPGDGQSAVYSEKADEAADYKVAGYPADLTAYPFIQAEVNATGKSFQDAADDILAAKSAWIATAALIEEARIGGKTAVDNATSIQGVANARDAAIATLKVL